MLKKILKWGASLIVLLVLIGSCAGDNSTKSTSSSATTKATQDAPKVKTYSAGQYKIGKDLPAGEYVVISNGDSYIELASDSTGNFSSIIANDVLKNRSVITVQDGQYLKSTTWYYLCGQRCTQSRIKKWYVTFLYVQSRY